MSISFEEKERRRKVEVKIWKQIRNKLKLRDLTFIKKLRSIAKKRAHTHTHKHISIYRNEDEYEN